jgi:hypothetical protein
LNKLTPDYASLHPGYGSYGSPTAPCGSAHAGRRFAALLAPIQ